MKLKSFLCILLVITLLFAFCVPSFAAVKWSSGYFYTSRLFTSRKVTFSKWGWDCLTIENKGNVPVTVQFGKGKMTDIPAYGEWNYWTKSNKQIEVNILPNRDSAVNKQHIVMKTTSGTIK